MERVAIFYSRLLYFMDIWYILWTFSIFYGHLAYFFLILVRCAKKNLATLTEKRAAAGAELSSQAWLQVHSRKMSYQAFLQFSRHERKKKFVNSLLLKELIV
jgi:hypothetical protein